MMKQESDVSSQSVLQKNAERFIAIALSQGGLQALRKAGEPTLETAIDVFSEAVRARMGTGSYPLDFCYRMRVGVK